MKFTELGQLLYNFTRKSARFLDKHHWLYYVLQFTWGFLATFIGLLISLVLIIIGKRPHRFHTTYFFEVGRYWGGFTMGMMFIKDWWSDDHNRICFHELGHTFQNCVLGPFFLFIVVIPSAVRYWYREIKFERKNLIPYTKYDDIWFEKSATDIGEDIRMTF